MFVFFCRSVIAEVVQQELSDSSTTDGYDYLRNGEDFLSLLLLERSAKLETGRIVDYVEITVPGYSDPMFHSHFRMNRTSVNVLTLLIMFLLDSFTSSFHLLS